MSEKLKKIKDFFKSDVYAEDTTGITIVSADDGFAVCTLLPEAKHLNADGAVQGGAIYTLGDFCFAVAANARAISEDGVPDTVTLSASITYLRPAKAGDLLTAEARCIKNGRKACCYEVTVFPESDRDKTISVLTVNGMKTR